MIDVVILGGGLAGLSLALQLAQTDSSLEISVLEKARFPVPEAAHKVGESTVELAAHYFGHTLGLKHHLQEEQLPKFGLRFFFGQGDISERLELGGSTFPPTPSYQLDRGRFENFLAQRCRAEGVRLLEDARVEEFALGQRDLPHSVTYVQGGARETLEAKWLVDATGRTALLKRRERLQKPSPHKGSAVWFRVAGSIHIDDWSSDPAWRAGHRGSNARWYSTNHLMGKGYWVWLIPLASGSTSLGIVLDEAVHPIASVSTLERALEWLGKFEPQCAQKLSPVQDKIQDFGVLRNYSQDCERVFSSKRWFITGEAGVFLDPFYSPGSDFIALSNTFVTRLIAEDRQRRDIRSKTRFFNSLYLSFFQNTLEIFQNQYPIFGHTQVMSLKIVWDLAVYWALLAYLFFQGRLLEPPDLSAVSEKITRVGKVNSFMQAAFRASGARRTVLERSGRIDFFQVPFLRELNEDLGEEADHAGFAQRLETNTHRLEQLASEILAALEHPSDGEGTVGYAGVAPSRELDDILPKLGLGVPAPVHLGS